MSKIADYGSMAITLLVIVAGFVHSDGKMEAWTTSVDSRLGKVEKNQEEKLSKYQEFENKTLLHGFEIGNVKEDINDIEGDIEDHDARIEDLEDG